MSQFGRRKGWMALAIAGLLAGGYGFIQSRGGWSELTQMPAKRDESTPAVQDGFELIGIARVTPEDRSPRLIVGDLNLGGAQGPIGSTRLWFRIPAGSQARSRREKAQPLYAKVRFSNGKVYTAAYEMADMVNSVATLLIPAGHPPIEWADVEAERQGAKARWRLKGLPKTPVALPAAGAARFEAEGARVEVRAYRQRSVPLNEIPKDLPSAGVVAEVRLESPPAKENGREVHVRFGRFLPEYLHPTDVSERSNPGTIAPGADPKLTTGMTFPYATDMRRIGFDGWLEVVDMVREPITFKNVRWEWLKIRGMGRVGQLTSETTELPDGSVAYVAGSLNERDGALQGYWQRQASPGSTTGPDEATIADLVAENESFEWQRRLREIQQGKRPPANFSIGTVRGFVVRKRVVRTVPFHLLIPVESRPLRAAPP